MRHKGEKKRIQLSFDMGDPVQAQLYRIFETQSSKGRMDLLKGGMIYLHHQLSALLPSEGAPLPMSVPVGSPPAATPPSAPSPTAAYSPPAATPEVIPEVTPEVAASAGQNQLSDLDEMY